MVVKWANLINLILISSYACESKTFMPILGSLLCLASKGLKFFFMSNPTNASILMVDHPNPLKHPPRIKL